MRRLAVRQRLAVPLFLITCACLLAACVTEPVDKPGTQWELVGEQPIVSTVGPRRAGEAAGDRSTSDRAVLEKAAAGGLPEEAASPDEDEEEDLLAYLDTATEEDLDPDYLSDLPTSPFHRLGRSVIRGMDGSWAKTYVLRGGSGQRITQLLAANVPNFSGKAGEALPPDALPERLTRWTLHEGFYQDVKEKLGLRAPLANTNVSDLLIVTAPPETLLFIDEFLYRILGDLPQIEIEMRVVEVNLDDLIDFDIETVWKNLEIPGEPFDNIDNPLKGNFGAGIPIDDQGTGSAFSSFTAQPSLPGFLLSLQGVHNDLTVDAIISLLQTVTQAQLISSPTITVLNGSRALLNTGDQIPTFEAKGVGLNPSITTKYQPTGVQIEMLPYLVSESEGLIRIDMSVDVSAVTSQIPFNLAGTEILNPVISARQAGTTIHVHDGQTVALGGLKSTQDIETITKVPLLGDIPLLGWLFKSRSSSRKTTEIVFFITPRVIVPSEQLVNPVR